MAAAKFCRGKVRRQNAVFQFGSGKYPDFEVVVFEAPASQRRGADDPGVETFRPRVVALEPVGDEQPRDKAVVVQAVGRPIETAIAARAGTPDIEPRVQQYALDVDSAVQAVRWRGLRFERLSQR